MKQRQRIEFQSETTKRATAQPDELFRCSTERIDNRTINILAINIVAIKCHNILYAFEFVRTHVLFSLHSPCTHQCVFVCSCFFCRFILILFPLSLSIYLSGRCVSSISQSTVSCCAELPSAQNSTYSTHGAHYYTQSTSNSPQRFINLACSIHLLAYYS